LFLDTLPVNAHTTASDSLWAGCPLLTIAGETFVSRVAGSLLRAVGLPELVTTNMAQYETLALRFATNPAQLAELRSRLATNRTASPLFDGGRIAATVERAYTTMWQRYAAGEKPGAFGVAST
jgi:predicted O-linked N-acetylglucosamine transferase (SPINDLY family)